MGIGTDEVILWNKESLFHYKDTYNEYVNYGILLKINNRLYFFFFLDSGVGAGIDSYYEYCLKAFILLGDESYRDKFNKVIWLSIWYRA